MEPPPNKSRTGRWESLMYSTSFLLIICGIPAAIALFILLMQAHDQSLRLTRSQALLCAGYMIASEILIAIILHLLAVRLTKRRTKNGATLN